MTPEEAVERSQSTLRNTITVLVVAQTLIGVFFFQQYKTVVTNLNVVVTQWQADINGLKNNDVNHGIAIQNHQRVLKSIVERINNKKKPK